MSRERLVIEKTMVKNELQLGDDTVVDDGVWVWKRRSNGNLGLSWKPIETIVFYIHVVDEGIFACRAPLGSTWTRWVHSEYGIDYNYQWHIYNGTVRGGHMQTVTSDREGTSAVDPDSTIVAEQTYYLT